ncbi:MAG: hypothetical protein ACFB15_04765 [Cyclobacteriaceae bacterium]
MILTTETQEVSSADFSVALRNFLPLLSIVNRAMRAKYEEILVPRAEVLFDPEERQYITFGAFFAITMFHEVAHGKANMIR